MNADKSYLAERLAERRRRVRAGVAGVGLLMALGLALLISYPAPSGHAPTIDTRTAASPADGPEAVTLR